MSSPSRTTYDEVPYDSKPFVETHPDRLATLATLFGMKPPAVERCRVLELGCADGTNLIPMAVSLPESTLMGVDLSSRQVGDGQAVIAALGLKNVTLRAASIADLGDDLGTFDYILCHGVYSWVPPAVQDKILAFCARQLAPQGVAYISYNTYPGWHVRRMVRDLLCYHARRFPEPRTQVQQARAFLDFLAQAVPTDATTTYGSTIRGAAEALKQKSDSYLLHEYLEEYNEPLYFHQFAARAEAVGLQYVGDAHLATMMTDKFSPEVQEALRRLAGNLIQMEQYLDFLTNRAFRRTLLCHAGIALTHVLRPESLMSLWIASLAKPTAAKVDLFSTELSEFRTPDGRSLSTHEPVVKAAMLHLAEVSPRPVPFETLWETARARSTPPAGAPAGEPRDAAFLAGRVLHYYLAGLVELHSYAPGFVMEVRPRPVGSPLARYQAAKGTCVTNLRHELVEINLLGRHLLTRLDGSRDHDALLAAVSELVHNGTLRLEQNGQPIREPAEVHSQLGKLLDQTLMLLARSACLVG